MMEAAVVLVQMESGVLVPLHWHVPVGRSGGSLPDSRDLWDVIWANRDRIAGVAHSHPGENVWPSETDYTTFKAVEAGLGKRLCWWIVAKSSISTTTWHDDPREDGVGDYSTGVWTGDWAGWPEYLREISNY